MKTCLFDLKQICGDAVNVGGLGEPVRIVKITEYLLNRAECWSVVDCGREVYSGNNLLQARDIFYQLSGRFPNLEKG